MFPKNFHRRPIQLHLSRLTCMLIATDIILLLLLLSLLLLLKLYLDSYTYKKLKAYQSQPKVHIPNTQQADTINNIYKIKIKLLSNQVKKKTVVKYYYKYNYHTCTHACTRAHARTFTGL